MASLHPGRQPSLDVASLRIEGRTHQNDLAAVVQVLLEVALVADLRQGLLSRPLKLELEDVDAGIGLRHRVDPAGGGPHLAIDLSADDLEAKSMRMTGWLFHSKGLS